MCFNRWKGSKGQCGIGSARSSFDCCVLLGQRAVLSWERGLPVCVLQVHEYSLLVECVANESGLALKRKSNY